MNIVVYIINIEVYKREKKKIFIFKSHVKESNILFCIGFTNNTNIFKDGGSNLIEWHIRKYHTFQYKWPTLRSYSGIFCHRAN